MSKTYSEKLKDPRWQKKRLEILERDKFTCQSCKSKTKTLHVHHVEYENNKNPWDYNSGILQTLCKDCHLKLSGLLKIIKRNMQDYSVSFLDKLDLIMGYELFEELVEKAYVDIRELEDRKNA